MAVDRAQANGGKVRMQSQSNVVHRGVLLPNELRNAPLEKLDAYVASVKRTNRAFVDACFALEDRARELGVELEA